VYKLLETYNYNNNLFGVARYTCETWTSSLHPTNQSLLIQLRHKSMRLKSSVLIEDRNCAKAEDIRTDKRRLFHIRGALIDKERPP